MKLVFLGTPEFAVPTLEAIVSAGHEVAAVYTQPDRPKGRGHALAPPPVKAAATRLSLAVRQPEKIRRPEVVEELRATGADAMVVVGYGQIIPQSIIDLPRLGIINVHASLLPKYRGAAPIQWAVANGATITGVTTMLINAGLDTGDLLLKQETTIGAEETSLDLGPRLAAMGAELLVETLNELERGSIRPVPQNNDEATYAPILKREDGLLDWNLPAGVVFNRARGFLPWPGAWTTLGGTRFSIWRCRLPGVESPGAPGLLFSSQKRLFVCCGGGSVLELLEVQLEGKKRMPVADFLNGFRVHPGEKLGS